MEPFALEPLAFLAFGLLALPQEDKQAHFLAGAAVAEYGRQTGMTPLQACGLSLTVGVLKEMLDAQGMGHADAKDGLATAAGCGVVFRF